jgi:hypothetical protein
MRTASSITTSGRKEGEMNENVVLLSVSIVVFF